MTCHNVTPCPCVKPPKPNRRRDGVVWRCTCGQMFVCRLRLNYSHLDSGFEWAWLPITCSEDAP